MVYRDRAWLMIVAPDCRWQMVRANGDRRTALRPLRRLVSLPLPPPCVPSFGRGALSVALDVHLDDGGVVHEAVDGRDRHRGIGEHVVPLAKRLVGGDQDRAPLVALADELEQHRGLGLIAPRVGEVVEHQQVVAIQPGDGGFQGELLTSRLQALDDVGRAGEQRAVAVLDQGARQGGDVSLA